MRETQVLIPSIIQDPHVLEAGGRAASTLHPIFANDSSGFGEGPVCRRVAIVDFNPVDGTLRSPAVFDTLPKVNKRATYLAELPCPTEGRWAPQWANRERCKRGGVADLEKPDYSDPFLKINAFGTVIRTLDFIESPTALDRRIKWAFPGEQLLVVPQAGELSNAFYHRESHSLQLFYFRPDPTTRRTVYAALSQDIVAHEAAHAVIDGIAPDLYDAALVDSLAIHEALADVTAVLLAIRSRDRVAEFANDAASALAELRSSSHFSRIAEEFGLWRGHGDSLRDVFNDKTLAADADAERQVDPSSPHSLSQVLSGALFGIYGPTFDELYELGQTRALFGGYGFKGRDAMLAAACRLASLVYKGLDWLPPGEVTLADYARACLAADAFFLPGRPKQREYFADQCRQRGIFARDETAPEPPGLNLGRVNASRLANNAAAREAFVEEHRELFGIPRGQPYATSALIVRAGDEPFLTIQARSSACNLSGPPRKVRLRHPQPLLLLKASWWSDAPCSLGPEFGRERRAKTGTTLAIRPTGEVHAVLRGGADQEASQRRDAFLAGLAAVGTLLPPGRSLGPDGRPLQGYVTSEQEGGMLRISGAYCALHIAEDPL